MYKECKRQKSILRQRKMEQELLREMLKKNYNEITISDICRHLEMPRKTFYRYFDCKYDALRALLNHAMEECMYSCGGLMGIVDPGTGKTWKQEWEKSLEDFFVFWMEKKELLDALGRSSMSGVLLEEAWAFAGGIGRYIKHERIMMGDSLFAEKLLFLFGGIMTLIVHWHRQGFSKSPYQMAATVGQMFY